MKNATKYSYIILTILSLIVIGLIGVSIYLNNKSNVDLPIIDNISHTTGAINNSTGFIDTGSFLDTKDVVTYGIDEVNYILENGSAGIDYSVIKLKPQSAGYTQQTEFINFLENNLFNITVPKDATGGYIYITLDKPLRYMPTIGVYQPVNLKTNIYIDNWGVYGRLYTTRTLLVNAPNKEFLYDITNVPVKTSKHTSTDWLEAKKGQTLTIGGFVSDSGGNSIDKIVFIRKRD